MSKPELDTHCITTELTTGISMLCFWQHPLNYQSVFMHSLAKDSNMFISVVDVVTIGTNIVLFRSDFVCSENANAHFFYRSVVTKREAICAACYQMSSVITGEASPFL